MTSLFPYEFSAESMEFTNNPLHHGTQARFAAPLPSHLEEVQEELVISGEVPSALNPLTVTY